MSFLSSWRSGRLLLAWCAYWLALLLALVGPAIPALFRLSREGASGTASATIGNGGLQMSVSEGGNVVWSLDLPEGGDFSKFVVLEGGRPLGTVRWDLLGAHNAENALAAIGAARHAGVPVDRAIAALAGFKGVKRRMELRGEVRGIAVYDDFAHHPTAVRETLSALRTGYPGRRIWAVFEPRSASSCRRIFQQDFAEAFGAADEVVIAGVFRSTLPEADRLSPGQLARDLIARGQSARYIPEVDEIVATLVAEAQTGDLVVLMSNGGFGGIHRKLVQALGA